MKKTKVEKLMEIIQEEGIFIEYVDFQEIIQGLYYKEAYCHPAIGINQSILSDKKLFTAVLAEEVGHHFTSIGDTTAEYYSYRGRLRLSKQEVMAMKWATEFLLPLDELTTAIRESSVNLSSLSDYLEVPEEILSLRFNFLAKKMNSIEIEENKFLMLDKLPSLYFYTEYSTHYTDENLRVAEY